MPDQDPEAEAVLERLPRLDAADLAAEWQARFGTPIPPALPDRLVRLALANAVQAGSRTPDPSTGRGRRSKGQGKRAPSSGRASGMIPQPGTVLVRDWGGVTHGVEVLEDGRFAWKGERWRSLSAIARAITGSRRSGPVFFRLKGGRKDGDA